MPSNLEIVNIPLRCNKKKFQLFVQQQTNELIYNKSPFVEVLALVKAVSGEYVIPYPLIYQYSLLI